jgi:APA family basic amino acid/polyamine antiporter
VHLIALGIGAVIGTGIVLVTGYAAASSVVPGVVISFTIAGAGTLFAALRHAELASMISVVGSVHTCTM